MEVVNNAVFAQKMEYVDTPKKKSQPHIAPKNIILNNLSKI